MYERAAFESVCVCVFVFCVCALTYNNYDWLAHVFAAVTSKNSIQQLHSVGPSRHVVRVCQNLPRVIKKQQPATMRRGQRHP